MGSERRVAAGAMLLAWVLATTASCEVRAPWSAKESKESKEVEAARAGGPATGAGPVAAGAAPGAPEPADADADLPEAVRLRPIGLWTPAPWLEGAQRVAAIKAHGVIVAAGLGWLRVHLADGTVMAEAAGSGAAQVLEILDVDGDGAEDIAIGRGMGRDALDAPASIAFYRYDPARGLSAPEIVALPPTTRAHVIGVAADPHRPGHVWLGMFDSKFMVTVLEAQRFRSGAWSTRVVARVRMPMAMAAGDVDGDGASELLLARPYGDVPDALDEVLGKAPASPPGDVLALRPRDASGKGIAREPLPSVRGARAIVVSGRDVLYADGWHQNYGSRARALITRARWEDGAWQAEILANVHGRYGYDRLRIGDVDGDGTPDVIAAGNGPAVFVPSLKPVTGSIPSLGSAEAWDAYPVDLDGDQRDEVIIIGPHPGIWQAGDVP